MLHPKATYLLYYIFSLNKTPILLSEIIGARLHMMQPQRSLKFGYVRYVSNERHVGMSKIWININQVLQKTEVEQWHGGSHTPYNLLAVHTTVPLVLYENQRLDMRLKTLAVSGGRPKFSASGLGRRGRRAPFELRLSVQEERTGRKEVPAWRSDVQLPLREDPWTLPRPGSSREGAERSHFWL